MVRQAGQTSIHQKMTDRFCAFFPCRNFDKVKVKKKNESKVRQRHPTSFGIGRRHEQSEGEEDFTSKDPYLARYTHPRIFFVFRERSCRNLPILIYYQPCPDAQLFPSRGRPF